MSRDDPTTALDIDTEDEAWVRASLGALADAAFEDPGGGDIHIAGAAAGRNPSSTARSLLVAAAVVVVVGVAAVVLTREPITDDVATVGTDVPATPTTDAPVDTSAPATTVPAAPPRFSTSTTCAYADLVDSPLFVGVELPPELTLRRSMATCSVLNDQWFTEDWYGGEPKGVGDFVTAPGTLRISLTRMEQRAMSVPVGSGRSDEWITIRGKPVEVFRPTGPLATDGLIQLSWVQDDNGAGMVVSEGYDLETVVAVAESFDRAVADHGPRNELAPMTREQALTKAQAITSSLAGIGEPTTRRTTPTALAAAGGPLLAADVVAPDRPIWVVAAAVGGDIPEPFGTGADAWGALVIDGTDGRLLTTVTGGADGSTGPAWLDALVDEDPAGR